MLLLGALVATLDDLAAVPAARDRAVTLRDKVITEFRQVYKIGTCSGARDAVVNVAEWERCVGGDARLFTNATPKHMNWYQAKALRCVAGREVAAICDSTNSNIRFVPTIPCNRRRPGRAGK